MREIKFKGWDGKKMTREYTLYEMLSFQLPNNGLKHNWLQYTGLKDKNGKKIYDGDVVRTEQGKGEVFNRLGCWYVGQGKELGYYDEPLEIIGNIYENPELLDIK